LQHKRDFAKYLLKRGMGSEKVRSKTGWFPGAADDKMRWEINDSGAKFKDAAVLNLREYQQLRQYVRKLKRDVFKKFRDEVSNENVNTATEVLNAAREKYPNDSLVRLLDGRERDLALEKKVLGAPADRELQVGDVFEHEELYKNYPELAEIELNPTIGSGNLGAIYSKTHPSGAQKKVIDLEADISRDPTGTMIHELQHGVQSIENFPRGSSPSAYKDLDEAIKYEQELAGEYLKEKGYALTTGSNQGMGSKYSAKVWNGLDTPRVPDAELPPDVLDRLDALRELSKEYTATMFDSHARTPYGRYRNTAGEYEANQATLRRALEIGTPGGSKFSPPWQHKPKYLIKKYHGE
jgi:hypothetical protein